MQVIVMALIGGLAAAAASLTGRVLVALGIGFVSYTGVSLVLGGLQTFITDKVSGLSGTVLQVLGVCQVDTAITMLFSAMAARLVLSGLTSGALKRMVVK